MSWTKATRAWVRASSHRAEGTGTTFSKNGRPVVHRKPGETAREKRMADGAASLAEALKEMKK